VLTRPARALRDPTRWIEEPTSMTELVVDGRTYRRGAVIGEWTRTPPGPLAGPVDAALVEAVASALGTLRAPDLAAPPRRIAHRVTIHVAPPAGDAVTHTLALGPVGPDGCRALVDDAPALVPLPACTAVVALATAR